MTSPSSPAVLPPGRVGSHAPAMLRDRVRSFAAWSADRDSTGARRCLQIALGLLWLLDAALQFQPYMFSQAFPVKILSSSAAGSPGPVAAPVRAASQLMLHNVVAWNAAFATIQLALAAALLWRPAVRAALAGTIIWSLAVWWLGESLGGILTGAASPLSGAPGAVILYALLALLAWPAPAGEHQHATVAGGSPLGARWSATLWVVLWSSCAYLVLQAPNRAPGALRAGIAGLAAGEPRWMAAIDQAAAAAAGHAGALIPVLFAAAFTGIGVAIFLPAAARPVLTLSIILALAIWVIGENFGGILTGQATDPNTGPLLVLVALAFWPLSISRRDTGSDSRAARARAHEMGDIGALTGGGMSGTVAHRRSAAPGT
jgi:hypothetical protein